MTLNVFFSPLKYIRQLFLAKFSVSVTFFMERDGTRQDGRTETHMDGQMDGHRDRQTSLGKYYFRSESFKVSNDFVNLITYL